MDSISEPHKPTPSPVSEAELLKNRVAQYRSAIPVSFFLVIIFFFFGFCNFKCNGTKVASLKGINLVTGTHLKTQMNDMLNNSPFNVDSGVEKSTEGQRIPPSFWAIIAFLSAIAGVVVFYRKEKKETVWGLLLAAVGFVALFILRLTIKSKIEDQGGGMIHIETSFLFGYWASLLAFVVAGGISYLRLKREKLLTNPAAPPSNSPTPIHINVITQHRNNDNV